MCRKMKEEREWRNELLFLGLQSTRECPMNPGEIDTGRAVGKNGVETCFLKK